MKTELKIQEALIFVPTEHIEFHREDGGEGWVTDQELLMFTNTTPDQLIWWEDLHREGVPVNKIF